MVIIEILLILLFFYLLFIDLFRLLFSFPTNSEKNQLIKNGEITFDETDKKKIKLYTKRLRVKQHIKELKNELNSLNIQINLEK